jgi:cytoskeletal protein RodZ
MRSLLYPNKRSTIKEILMSAGPPQPSPNNKTPPPNKEEPKKKRKYLWFIFAIVLIVIILVAVFVVFWGGFLFSHGPQDNLTTQHNLTAFNEHLVIYSHTASGTETEKMDLSLSNLEGTYPVGQQLAVEIPYHPCR